MRHQLEVNEGVNRRMAGQGQRRGDHIPIISRKKQRQRRLKRATTAPRKIAGIVMSPFGTTEAAIKAKNASNAIAAAEERRNRFEESGDTTAVALEDNKISRMRTKNSRTDVALNAFATIDTLAAGKVQKIRSNLARAKRNLAAESFRRTAETIQSQITNHGARPQLQRELFNAQMRQTEFDNARADALLRERQERFFAHQPDEPLSPAQQIIHDNTRTILLARGFSERDLADPQRFSTLKRKQLRRRRRR